MSLSNKRERSERSREMHILRLGAVTESCHSLETDHPLIQPSLLSLRSLIFFLFNSLWAGIWNRSERAISDGHMCAFRSDTHHKTDMVCLAIVVFMGVKLNPETKRRHTSPVLALEQVANVAGVSLCYPCLLHRYACHNMMLSTCTNIVFIPNVNKQLIHRGVVGFDIWRKDTHENHTPKARQSYLSLD